MITALHSSATWAWIIIAFAVGVFLPRVLGWITDAGYRLYHAVVYYGGRALVIGLVVGAVYFGVRAVA